MSRPVSNDPKETTVSLRLTLGEKSLMESRAQNAGFRSLSDYLRFLHKSEIERNEKRGEFVYTPSDSHLNVFDSTKLGKIYNGNSLDYLFGTCKPKSIDLIMTSPPFGLVRKKTYGNEDAEEYCNWFRPFAEGFKRTLKDSGSLVIDIGGAWKPGQPTRSLYHFDLLIMLCKEYKFHLCLEHYWWNPSKLPTPAEWVNVRRVRVKDAVNCVWWLSPTPYPKSNNKRVLAPYSSSMLSLLKNGYTAKERPSGHIISKNFSIDNGGSIPPNLLAIANTESNGAYQEYCRKKGLAIHPARFPSLLPEYFIRFLTDKGDLVVDPFGGSSVTGMVAERLGRKWATIELNTEYCQGALARFQNGSKRDSKQTTYNISTPCAMPSDDEGVPLIENGGQTR